MTDPRIEPVAKSLWDHGKHPRQGGSDWVYMAPEDERRQAFMSYAVAALAAADKVATAEGLVSTRAGLALANAAYTEGAHDMLNACNSTDNVFVNPVSPYSAPLLRMIKGDPR